MTAISTATQKAHALKSINDWGEAVQFRADPHNGEGRSVTVIVDRTYVASLEQIPAAGSPMFVVQVLNDATDGIAASEIQDGRSTLEIPTLPGGTPQKRTMQKRHDSDAVVIYLECR